MRRIPQDPTNTPKKITLIFWLATKGIFAPSASKRQRFTDFLYGHEGHLRPRLQKWQEFADYFAVGEDALRSRNGENDLV